MKEIINNEIDIEMLLDDLIHLENRLIDNYNDDEPFVQYEEDRLCVGNAIDIIEQLKSNQNKVAVEKLEEIKEFCIKKRTEEANCILTINVDDELHIEDNLLDKINSMIKELKGEK